MLAVLGGCVVILAVVGLGFYAVRKMGPGSFRVRTGLLRMFSFSMEIESSGAVKKSSASAELEDGLAEKVIPTPRVLRGGNSASS
jgi:hypothetical protein